LSGLCVFYYNTYVEKPTLPHDIQHHDAKEPTCSEIGWNAYDTCKQEDCKYTTYVEKPALSHDIQHHDAKEPTCTEIGWDAYDTCKREGCKYTTYVEKPALSHDIQHHEAKEPSCTEIGWGEYKACSRCDYSTYKEKSALGHSLSEPITENGENRRYCANCNYYESDVLDKIEQNKTVIVIIASTSTVACGSAISFVAIRVRRKRRSIR